MVFWMVLEESLGARMLLGVALAVLSVKAVLSATEYNRISIAFVWRALHLSSWDEPWNAV
ncbi:hypothetical protein FIBSPDRAFT_956622 [Athelia psychrophila]|uniref:Uncharacterized protein n=1 Tax=Athelia psychrophila TaxID=1759441 RepID=A0A166GQD6_9AGAM|nr:hypothetical protein FIBSPDRAFT_956622 [Fibularhizoctonia sp. CBS 109695]